MPKQKPTTHKELLEAFNKLKIAIETNNTIALIHAFYGKQTLIEKNLYVLERKINAVPYYITDHSTPMTEC